MSIKLSEKYKVEREEICLALIDILQLDKSKSFLLSELDENEGKQNAIMNMKGEIRKHFACSQIAAFKPNFECKRPYISIVRSILRDQGYSFLSTHVESKNNGITDRTTKYTIFREID